MNQEFKPEAYLWQQCLANTGETGTFIAPQGTKNPISPVFKDTAEFFLWAKNAGWVPSVPYSFRYIFLGEGE